MKKKKLGYSKEQDCICTSYTLMNLSPRKFTTPIRLEEHLIHNLITVIDCQWTISLGYCAYNYLYTTLSVKHLLNIIIPTVH